jgi:hypothetical protein
MKTMTIFLVLLSLFYREKKSIVLTGAWQWENGNEIHTVIFSDKFYAVTEYNRTDNIFISTYGGSYTIDGNEVFLKEEFNTFSPDQIGKERKTPITENANSIQIALKTKSFAMKNIDRGKPGLLAGAWLITGRNNGGEFQKIVPGSRRTMKILSGTRFQWIAYNTETKEFFGTGGGIYATENGKYTESIEFFSRDNSRVGNRLEFNFSFEDGKWRHQGLSSKGDPIDEIWTKRETLGI